MLSFDKAYEHATGAAVPVESERVPVAAAAGRVLAAPVRADRDLPPFDRSERDGFAVRAADFADGRAHLAITEETIYAGVEAKRAVVPGECSRIMTGAALPPGADAVVPVEKSSEEGGRVTLDYDKVRPGIHVHGRGADAAKGEELVGAGSLLDPGRLAVAFSVGAAELDVHRRVRVNILSTGDELVGVGETPSPAQIRDSNGPGLAALIGSFPYLERAHYGRIADDEPALEAAVAAALEESDALVLTGGVSMGDKDFVPAVLRRCGVEQILHKINIRPGKPFWLGRSPGGGLVFGLPGNPMSVQVTFREIALPALRRMAGLKDFGPAALHLPLAEELEKTIPLAQFIQGRLVTVDGKSGVAAIPHHGSGDFVSASRADGVLVLPEGELVLERGDTVRFHLWRCP